MGVNLNIMNRSALLTLSVGMAMGFVAPAPATGYFVSSNGVDKCQAFTPGVTNTIRNRVSGAENTGSAPVAVACVFELAEVYDAGTVAVEDVYVYFKNGGNSSISISCSLLPGDLYEGLGTLEGDSVDLAAGAVESIHFSGPYAVYAIGVNCMLPPHATIAHTVVRYQDAHA